VVGPLAQGAFLRSFAGPRDRAHRSAGRGALTTGGNAAPEEVHPRYRQSHCIKASALETLKTSLTPWPLDLSTLQPLHLAAAVASAFCYSTGSRNYLAPILIRTRTCSPALSAEEPDTGEVYHNS